MARTVKSRVSVLVGGALLALTAAIGLAGCAGADGSDYTEAYVRDSAGVDETGVLPPDEEAAILDCARQFGARAGADRVVVVILDEEQWDSDTAAYARAVFDEDARDNQLVLVENLTTRYVWVEVGGAIRHHVGADSVDQLTIPHIEAFRAGPRQGICATLAEAASHVNGWKRIPMAGWILGLLIPLAGAGAFLIVLSRHYRLKNAVQTYDLRLARFEHLAASDNFIRAYRTTIRHSSSGSSGGGGGSRSSGGGTHF